MWIARAFLLIFVIKMHWGMWDIWEWTLGDEPEHLSSGVVFFHHFSKASMDWSPLYRAFYGAVYLLTENALLATVLHRVVVVFAVVLVFFEVLRRIVPLPVALLVGLWWASIPANLNPLYTVHAFANLANLVALYGFVVSRSVRGRGWSLAALLASALFVRTEAAVCFCVMVAAIGWFEWRRVRRGDGLSLKRFLWAYAMPVAVVAFVWIGLSAATAKGVLGTVGAIRYKAALTFSHNFSFTYFQQHPEPDLNVWYEYPRICEQEFGKPVVSLGGALRRNPEAFAGHVRTNSKNLIPGLQLAFFNVRAAEQNPEMTPTAREPLLAWLGTAGILLIWLAGGFFVFRDREYFLKRTFRSHAFGWICLLGFLLQAIPVAVLILARPGFYLSGIASLFALTGLFAWAIWRHLPRLFRWEGIILPVAVVILFAVPSPWLLRDRPYDIPRAVFEALGERRLIMAETGTHIVAPLYQPRAMALYLDPDGKIIADGMETLLPVLSSNEPLGKWLYDRRVKLFFACGEQVVNSSSYQKFAANPAEYGWMLTAKHHTGGVYWTLFEPIEPYPEDRVKMEQMGEQTAE